MSSRRLPAEIYTPAEISKLLSGMSRRGNAGIRNRALTVMMWRAGLRIGEALALQLRDVDLDLGWVTVRHGKGDRTRRVPLDQGTVQMLHAWLRRRAKLRLSPRAPLFCTFSDGARGGPLMQTYVRNMLKRAAGRGGVDRRVHPHGLRHTYAVELEREGTPANVIRRLLGHTSLRTTQVYLDHLEPADLRDAIAGRQWPEQTRPRPRARSLSVERETQTAVRAPAGAAPARRVRRGYSSVVSP